MAGIVNIEHELFYQLKQDGWYIQDMKEYEHKIFEIVTWCRVTLGSMLTVYDLDAWNCRWHGGRLETYAAGIIYLFAFKDEADYTMLKLKFS